MKIRYYKLCLILTILLVASFMSGCFSKEASSGEIVELSFADTVSIDQIKKLDGQMVRIVGFMSLTSPLDGSYIYLQNMPYQSCPFCLPNTNILANTVAVYAPSGQSFRFMDIPILVTGKLKVEDMTDDMGFSYNYRIVDAKIEKAEVSGLGRDIRIYTELVDKGFAAEFISIFEDLDKALVHQRYNIEKEDVKPVDMKKVEDLKDMFAGLNLEEYKDIYEVVEKLEGLIETGNSLIKEEQWDLLYLLDSEAGELWDEFVMWLLKPSI